MFRKQLCCEFSVVLTRRCLHCRVLETKLAEAKSKKDTLKARAASAKTSKQIQVRTSLPRSRIAGDVLAPRFPDVQ